MPVNDILTPLEAGIGVGTHITAAEAAVDADSWAFFAADCGGALTDGDILAPLAAPPAR